MENINSIWPTALTGAALCNAKAENHDAVVIAAKIPVANPGRHSLNAALSCEGWKILRYINIITD